MTKFPRSQSIPVAVKQRTSFPIGGKHITTSNFMQLNVARAFEMVPGQSIKGKFDLFTRLEPLSVPPFANARITHRQFWVPFRTVMPGWNDFITDTPHIYNDSDVGIIPHVPLIKNRTFYDFFSDMQNCTPVLDIDGNAKYDFMIGQVKYAMTADARHFYKILRSLGYSFFMDPDVTLSYSAMPILCLTKLYLDWFFPAQYVNDMQYLYLKSLFSDDVVDTTDRITVEHLVAISTLVYTVSYEPDYFTAAWDNPVSPNDGVSSSFSIDDPTYGSSNKVRTSDNSDSTPIITSNYGTSINNVSITQYQIDAVQALTDYMKRHQIVGARAIDRYLARFGVKLSAEKLNLSILLSQDTQQIQFGDVTSTSSTDTASLGDFAGKGLSYGDGGIDFSTDEYGMFFVVSSILPDVGYYEGLNRQVLHTTKLDFFTPEFDALGVQAISSAELFMPIKKADNVSLNTLNSYLNKVFGFTSRYAEYKKGYDQLTGDYAVESVNTGKDSWNLLRKVPFDNSQLASVIHSYDFIRGYDREQYNRIFQVTTDMDHFNMVYDFNITTSFPGASLFDTYEFKDEDKSEKVKVDVAGSTVS